MLSSESNYMKQKIWKEFIWPQGALLKGAPSRDAILEVIFHEIAECVYPYKFKSVRYSFIYPSDHISDIFQ